MNEITTSPTPDVVTVDPSTQPDALVFLYRPLEDAEANALVEFYQAFQPNLNISLWAKLMMEEAGEVLNAFLEEGPEQQLKELADLRYVTTGFGLLRPEHISAILTEDHPVALNLQASDSFMQILNERVPDWSRRFDLVTLETAFTRVHASNMTKLGDDGKPIRREDGKVMKGPFYSPPDLSDLVTA